jgi:predicted Fe-S protein YdhL (DUF1289 family)
MSSGPENTIETPCVNICVVDRETSQCIGCGRTRVEIADWLNMSAAERRDVMTLLPDRLANLTKNRKRRGGAKSRRQKTSPVIINFKGP